MRRFLEELGHPEQGIKYVHIAGSKGKSSVAGMLASVLTHSGIRTGLFTSPSLHKITERIKVDGDPITKELFVEVADRVLEVYHSKLPEATLFDCLTAIALCVFAQIGVEYAVMETGLGGRLDSTNVLKPELTIITTIELDHTDVLGTQIEQIATEKAGIIKPGVTLVTSTQRPEVENVLATIAQTRDARLIKVPNTVSITRYPTLQNRTQRMLMDDQEVAIECDLALLGECQIDNVGTVTSAAKVLRSVIPAITPAKIQTGLERVSVGTAPGIVRWEGIDLIIDSCHTMRSAHNLVQLFNMMFETHDEPVLIFGTTRGHDFKAVANQLSEISSKVIVTQTDHPKSISANEVTQNIRNEVKKLDVIATTNTVADALVVAQQRSFQTIAIAGSTALAAEAIQATSGIKSDFRTNRE